MIRSSQASATSWPGLALFIFKVIIFCFIINYLILSQMEVKLVRLRACELQAHPPLPPVRDLVLTHRLKR